MGCNHLFGKWICSRCDASRMGTESRLAFGRYMICNVRNVIGDLI